MNFAVVLGIIHNLPKAIAAAAEFKELFNQLLKGFNSSEQAQLKDAYAHARERSDSAQADFQEASKGN